MELIINGIIGWDTTLNKVRASLKDLKPSDDLVVKITSPGGSVFEGISIFNDIKNAKAKSKTSYITGLAASMASYIALASDKVKVEANAIYMYHNAWSPWADGDHDDLRKQADILESITNLLADAYVAKTGRDKATILKEMKSETWLFGDEIKASGFADEVVGSNETSDKNALVLTAKASFKESTDLLNSTRSKNETDLVAMVLPNQKEPKSELLMEKTLPNSEEIKNEEKKKKMDLKTLQNEHPDVYNAVFEAGVAQERKRVNDLAVWQSEAFSDEVNQIASEAILQGKSYVDVSSQLAAAAAKVNTKSASLEQSPTIDTNPSNGVSLTEEEQAMAKGMGVTNEEFAKSKKDVSDGN